MPNIRRSHPDGEYVELLDTLAIQLLHRNSPVIQLSLLPWLLSAIYHSGVGLRQNVRFHYRFAQKIEVVPRMRKFSLQSKCRLRYNLGKKFTCYSVKLLQLGIALQTLFYLFECLI